MASAHRDLAYDKDPFEGPREECGVFGVYSSVPNASRVAFFALFALNHRGQESAGIASLNPHGALNVHKGMGLVSQVFTEHDMENLAGSCAIGHTRYSTAGGSKLTGAQPFVFETELGPCALAHNGQIAKQADLRRTILARGTGLFSSSDTELLAQLMCRPHDVEEAAQIAAASGADGTGAGARPATARALGSGGSATATPSASPRVAEHAMWSGPPKWTAWVCRIAQLVRDCEGAFSLVILTREGVFGVRDCLGMRPLCIGKKVDAAGSVSYHLASESCALGTIGSDLVREVLPGEIVRLSEEGVTSFQPLRGWQSPTSTYPRKATAFCSFELVYFARPDSILEGQMVHSVRTRLGARLAEEAPALGADLVSGVPDSSLAAAHGFAKTSGIPFSEIFCKNRYIGRTFIKPDDSLRKDAIRLKYNVLSHVVAGKSLVLVDDSLVRGNTLAALVPLLRAAGATAVHIRITSPAVRHPCYMGVDIGSYEELAAHRMSEEEIRASIHADSLAYLSREGMVGAIEAGMAFGPEREGIPTGHCTACFDGAYPLEYDKEDAEAAAGCKGC